MKRLRLPLLYVLSFALSILPLAIYVLLNLDSYVTTPKDAVRLSFGGVIVLVLIGLKTLGKLRLGSRVTALAFVFVLSYLLKPVLLDLEILSFLALVGEALDLIVCHFIKKEKAKTEGEKIAKETARQIEGVLNGRV